MDGAVTPTCPGCSESARQLAERDRRIAELEKRIAELMGRVEAVERVAKRQAAPFSKKPPKPKPKKPGRKSGQQHGQHAHRPPPPENLIDETLHASLPEHCPQCGGGNLEETHTDAIFQEEIRRQPLRRKFIIHCGTCRSCGQSHRGRHPLQTSEATGAAQSQLGSDAQATIVYLNKATGLSHGKIAELFGRCFGIALSRGGAAHVVRRARQRLEPAHQEIVGQLQNASHITPDETGWRNGGHTVWLHAWVGDNGATLYRIDPQRSADVLQTVIGLHWSGSMTHDGYSSYDRFEDAIHQQCLDHALRRAQSLLETQTGNHRRFPQEVIDLLMSALAKRESFAKATTAGKEPTQEQRGDAYEDFVERLRRLTEPTRADEANERFARHLHRHVAEWFTFLLDATIPATNHRAEQALKTPIVNRKVWGGNRTDAGAQDQGVISSVLETCKRTSQNAFDYVSATFRGVVASLFSSTVTSGR